MPNLLLLWICKLQFWVRRFGSSVAEFLCAGPGNLKRKALGAPRAEGGQPSKGDRGIYTRRESRRAGNLLVSVRACKGTLPFSFIPFWSKVQPILVRISACTLLPSHVELFRSAEFSCSTLARRQARLQIGDAISALEDATKCIAENRRDPQSTKDLVEKPWNLVTLPTF